MVCTPRRFSSRSNGAARSRLAPIPVIRSSGGPARASPETLTRSRTPSTSRKLMSGEGTDTGDVPSHDEGLDRLGAFIRVQRLDVGHMPDDVEVEQYAVAAEQVARLGDNSPRLSGVVHLRDGGDRV